MMIKNKKTLEEEVNSFLEIWDCRQIIQFLRDVIPLFELYDVDEVDDWVKNAVGGDNRNVQTVRLIRTVYLVSKISENHSAKLCYLKIHFKGLWERLEKIIGEDNEETS